MSARNYVLRHVTTGRFYSHSHLGGDVMTDSRNAARGWATAEAAARFAARFGNRYEVAPAVPVHLLPTSCYVCGSPEGTDHSGNATHDFWSNTDAAAHFAAEDARSRGPVYSDGTTTPEAHYVAQTRPY